MDFEVFITCKAAKTSFNSSTLYGFDLYLIYIPKTLILRSLLHAKADKTSFNSSTVYGIDMDLICNWSIFYGKHRFWGLYFKQNKIKHHSTPVQYMEWIWILSLFDVLFISNQYEMDLIWMELRITLFSCIKLIQWTGSELYPF